MGSNILLPFRQYFKSRTPQLNVLRIAETFAMDMLFSSIEGLGGITCAKNFTETKSKCTQIF